MDAAQNKAFTAWYDARDKQTLKSQRRHGRQLLLHVSAHIAILCGLSLLFGWLVVVAAVTLYALALTAYGFGYYRGLDQGDKLTGDRRAREAEWEIN